MPRDSWHLEPTEMGTVKITLIKRSGKQIEIEMKPNEVGAYIAGIMAAFDDAHKISGHPDLGADKSYDGSIPPVVPSTIGLLNPERNKWAMFLRIGEAHIVIDISHLDLADLGQALIAASAPEVRGN